MKVVGITSILNTDMMLFLQLVIMFIHLKALNSKIYVRLFQLSLDTSAGYLHHSSSRVEIFLTTIIIQMSHKKHGILGHGTPCEKI